MTLVRRAVASADKGPRHTKSQLFVTVDLETLRNGLRGAGVTWVGRRRATLAPETVRRLACDATIIPTVMGVAGAVVDLGWSAVVHLGADQAVLAARPALHLSGVHMPASWADAHHLGHWADGGPTDLSNAALLCERHHTIVHNRRYAGRLVEDEDGARVSGTSPSAPTTGSWPAWPPENQRDPAPHPAPPGGATGMSTGSDGGTGAAVGPGGGARTSAGRSARRSAGSCQAAGGSLTRSGADSGSRRRRDVDHVLRGRSARPELDSSSLSTSAARSAAAAASPPSARARPSAAAPAR